MTTQNFITKTYEGLKKKISLKELFEALQILAIAERGRAEIKAGKTISHEDVMKHLENRRLKK